MSHTLAKKFDKIVSKLTIKHKENSKCNGTEHHDEPNCGECQHESILQRMKGHLTHPQVKVDSHQQQQQQQVEGAPPPYVILDDLKESPFRGMTEFEINIPVRETLFALGSFISLLLLQQRARRLSVREEQ